MNEIVKLLEKYNEAYRKGEPMVPNSVYDALLEKIPDNHPYKHKIEPESLYKNRVKHKKPMLSMQKAKTEKEIDKWISYIEKNSGSGTFIRATAKLDGIAGKLENDILSTRGDGQYGNDVTNALVKGLVGDLNEPSLGEFVVKLDYFNNHLSEEFSNPRNFVSGAIMSDVSNSITDKAFKDKAIVFQSYSTLPSVNCNLVSLLRDFRTIEEEVRASVNYDIDGVIFEVIDEDLKFKLGNTSHHPNWAIALKPKDKEYESVVTNIVWNVGRSGKVTPVVMIEPIDIEGATVSKASGHNARMIETMGIDIGKSVTMIRSGSVIPYITGVL